MPRGRIGPYLQGAHPSCPTATLKGTITEVDEEKQQIILVTKREQAIAIIVGEKTKYRIPGFKQRDLKINPLAKVPIDSRARIVYCTADVEVLEVKVLKPKRK